MSGFTKLFSDIILSSVWSEDDKTRIVWISMLAISNADGFVSGSLPGLARAAHVSIEDCEKALKKLALRDPYSRTKDHEGRRIEVVDGGWLILNYRLYRDRVSDDPNAVKIRERVRRHRERQKEAPVLPPSKQNTEDRGRGRGRVTLRNVTVTPASGKSAAIPTLEMCQQYALDQTCGFPPQLVAEWYDKQADRGWGNDWKARMRGAVPTWREIAFKRKILKRNTGFDAGTGRKTAPFVPPEKPKSERPTSPDDRPVTSAAQVRDIVRRVAPELARHVESRPPEATV